MTTEQHRYLCSLCTAIARLLSLTDNLRRDNSKKWELSLAEWQEAVDGVLTVPETELDNKTKNVVTAAWNSVRRLANSGEARFGSVSIGRSPSSSWAGERFYNDLKRTHHRLDVLIKSIKS